MAQVTKPWWASKTVWLNVLTTVVGVLTLLSEAVPAEYVPAIVTAVGVVNVVLRVWFTNTGLTLSAEKKKAKA